MAVAFPESCWISVELLPADTVGKTATIIFVFLCFVPLVKGCLLGCFHLAAVTQQAPLPLQTVPEDVKNKPVSMAMVGDKGRAGQP